MGTTRYYCGGMERVEGAEQAKSIKVSPLTYRRLRRLSEMEQRTIITVLDRAVERYETQQTAQEGSTR